MSLTRPCVLFILQSCSETLRVSPNRCTFHPIHLHTFLFVAILWHFSCITHIQAYYPLFPSMTNTVIDRSGYRDTVSLKRSEAAFLHSAHKTGDFFIKPPVSVPDRPRSLEKGDQNTSQTLDPRPALALASIEGFPNPFVSHSAKSIQASIRTRWMLRQRSVVGCAQYISISNERPIRSAEHQNHVTWSRV